MNEEKKIEEQPKIESPIDMSDFEEPALKQETKEEQVKIESPIDVSDFEEPALKIEPEHNESVELEENPPVIDKNENQELENKSVDFTKTEKDEPKSVTLDELNSNGPKKVLTKTKGGLNKALLTTYIFGAITLFFLIITGKSYYCGFKYYDTPHHQELTPKVEVNQ